MAFLFKYPMTDIAGFHIEPTNICTLKCPGCARTRFKEQWPNRWQNHNLDIDMLMRFLDVDIADKLITLEGNYGDSIYHPRFIELVAAFKNRGCRISIVTNGSYRTTTWWQALCRLLDSNDSITFSIDGIPTNFTKYRINADWKSIFEGITVCVASSAKVIWKYIPFAFNENDIDTARNISRNMGIDEFVVRLSERFDTQTEHLIPVTDLVGDRKTPQDQVKQGIEQQVDPLCYKGKSYFISATGHYSPCCYVADHRFYYKTDFGKNQKSYSIENTTFTEIQTRSTVVGFYQTLVTDPQTVCQFNCPKV